MPRNPGTSASVGPVVAELIADVRERGAEALLDHQEDTGGRRLALRSATLSPDPPRRTGDPRSSGSP
ncbi:hypothetical protein C5D09_09190, partial [Rathayibacter sp. AY1C9]|uniref:hypothetical protein n=1 Tax=Rathayibacter sp. AY1C9 TaxID=2080541 RepID=UPI000D4D99D0